MSKFYKVEVDSSGFKNKITIAFDNESEGNQENLSPDYCPDCNVYCVKRFIDGRCE